MLKRIFFSIWYFFRPPWDTGTSPPELLSYLQSHLPGRALDLGCGTGTNAITIAKHGWQVTGIDFARPAVQRGRKKASHAGVEVDLQVGDVTQLNHLDWEFDLILDIGCFHSLNRPERQRYIENLGRLLSPGGHFLLYAMLNDPQDTGKTGIGLSDIALLENALTLVNRTDGVDRGVRASTWLTFYLSE